jgi:hypothetical protein
MAEPTERVRRASENFMLNLDERWGKMGRFIGLGMIVFRIGR